MSSLSLSYWSPGESYMTPGCMATHFFTAIRIRVNWQWLNSLWFEICIYCSMRKFTNICTCNGQWDGGVRGPWGKRGHVECWGRQGTQPPKRGGKWAIGIRQWRRLDALEMLEGTRDGLGTTLNHPYAQSTCYMCIMCNNPSCPWQL